MYCVSAKGKFGSSYAIPRTLLCSRIRDLLLRDKTKKGRAEGFQILYGATRKPVPSSGPQACPSRVTNGDPWNPGCRPVHTADPSHARHCSLLPPVPRVLVTIIPPLSPSRRPLVTLPPHPSSAALCFQSCCQRDPAAAGQGPLCEGRASPISSVPEQPLPTCARAAEDLGFPFHFLTLN